MTCAPESTLLLQTTASGQVPSIHARTVFEPLMLVNDVQHGGENAAIVKSISYALGEHTQS